MLKVVVVFPLNTKLFLSVFLFCFALHIIANGSHIVGGNLEMVAMDKAPGRYRVALAMYFDEINQNVGGSPDADALIYIYRKSDNKKLTSFYVNFTTRQSVIYSNQACATVKQLKTTLYHYERIITLNPKDYDDPAGYYMTWQYCCRNGTINNINNPYTAGQTFYLEFPPLIRYGKPLLNSSPVFDQVDGEYVCINEPFRFSFDAHDADGDELRYSMATPFERLDSNLYSNGGKGGQNVQWLPGFGPDNAIPGNPPLSINKQTGELTVTATTQGLYVFTVIVEEYRNGQYIGLVRRDYQLLVVDCPPITPPDATITVDNQVVKEIQFCEGKLIELRATKNDNWSYQWKKDGNSIQGANTPALLVAQSGIYQLITSLKNQCSKTRRSEIKVSVTTAHFKIKPQGSLSICGLSGMVYLDAPTGNELSYQWYKNGNLLTDVTRTLSTTQVGTYWAVVRDNGQGCSSTSDTVRVLSSPLPEAILTTQRATTAICDGDSLLLSALQHSGYQYKWSLNGTVLAGVIGNRLTVRRAGQYLLTVIDTIGCVATTPFTLTVVPTVKITLDSLGKYCRLSGATTATLRGNPAGGIYAGAGVSGNQFDPQKSGVGRHDLTYTVKSDFVCQQGVAHQTVIVADPAVSVVPAQAVTAICANDSLLLMARTMPASTGSAVYSYVWTLNGQPLSVKDKILARQAGQYQVSIIDTDGCNAQSKPYALIISPAIRVMMDSVPVFCGSDHSPVRLEGYPDGGVFNGPGITGNQYDPRQAGVGVHSLQYTVNSPSACQNGIAFRTAIVRPLPTLHLGPDLEIARGGTVQLNSGASGNYKYTWLPAASLSDPTHDKPKATPEQTTSYTVTAQDEYGCFTTSVVTIYVYERIWIPNAFTPNEDGQNDTWELRGIESYPQAEVTIYNRWGEVVYFSQGYKRPFDGSYQGVPLLSGMYAYRIKSSPTRSILQGSLMLIR